MNEIRNDDDRPAGGGAFYRRRSEPIWAVQWHGPGGHRSVVRSTVGFHATRRLRDDDIAVFPGDWLVWRHGRTDADGPPDDVLRPAEFNHTYEPSAVPSNDDRPEGG